MTEDLPCRILEALHSTCRTDNAGLHVPNFAGNEKVYLNDCIDSTMVSYIGRYVDNFEELLASYCGTKFALAMSSGTAALQLALHVAGVTANDEVIVPALSFAATANAIHANGAIPHFIDIEPNSLGMCPDALRLRLDDVTVSKGGQRINRETGRRIAAIVPVHCFGHPCNVDSLMSVANEFTIDVIEDAAEALGSWRNSTHAGSFGLAGMISFNGNKIVTTGGGGAIITNDEKFAMKLRHLSTTAKLKHQWRFRHDMPGYNLRMPNVNAAIGCAQMEQLQGFIQAKRRLSARYRQKFEQIKGVRLLNEPESCESNYWLNTLILDAEFTSLRDEILDYTNKNGFGTRPAWDLLNHIPPYDKSPSGDLTISREMVKRIVNIPSSAHL